VLTVLAGALAAVRGRGLAGVCCLRFAAGEEGREKREERREKREEGRAGDLWRPCEEERGRRSRPRFGGRVAPASGGGGGGGWGFPFWE